MTSSRRGDSPSALLRELRALRSRFTPDATRRKVSLLTALEEHPPGTGAALLSWHDDLLFLRAFPDDHTVRQSADRGLELIPDRCRRLGRERLFVADDSGMTGSETTAALSGEVVSRLIDHHGHEMEIAWEAIEDQEALDPLLRRDLFRAEEDGFDHGDLSTRAWIRRARSETDAASDLAWLFGQCPRSGVRRRDWLLQYDSLEIPVRWRLARSTAAATVLRWREAPSAFRTEGLRRSPRAPRRIITSPLDDLVLLESSTAEEVIRVAYAALAARGREVHAISYGNPDEVYLAPVGPGVSLVLIGARHEARMSLESNYGYVVFANGVPFGYGGVTPLFHQANTGLNVFPAFRHSEAAAIYAEVLRAFRSLFGVTRFLANPYQVGGGNPEAVATGAFWFYYRLGFRPRDPEVRQAAAAEYRRIRRGGHRTDRKTLRVLGEGDLILRLPDAGKTSFFEEPWLARLGLAVTDARRTATSSGQTRRAARTLSSTLGLTSAAIRRWTARERESLDDLAPLFQLLDLAQWPGGGRRDLARLIRAKGAPQERGFVLQSQGIPRLFGELRDLALRTRI